jgi:MoxR-like ATPase
MYYLNNAMSKADVQLRADVWWSLYDDAENHNYAIVNGGQRIKHLLTPIPGRLSAEQIISIIPTELRDRWRRDNSHRAHGPARDVMEGLEKLDGIEAESSRKRKRGKDSVEEVIRILKRDYPDMKLEDSKDILPSLLSQVKK